MFLTRYKLWTLVCLLGVTGPLISLSASELCVRVIDEADLPLPHARLNVTRMVNAPGEDSRTYNGSTDSKGQACIKIPEGTYSVEVGLTGFLNVRYYPVRVMFPNSSKLNFRLPLGDITEGSIVPEAILSGILQNDGKAIEGATICILQQSSSAVVACGLTNVFGEYALSVPPGIYNTEIRTAVGEVYHSTASVPRPGSHWNRLSLGNKIR
jgi:hypothetical protein